MLNLSIIQIESALKNLYMIGFCAVLNLFLRHLKLTTEGCLANSDGANSDDRANSDDFLMISIVRISPTPL